MHYLDDHRILIFLAQVFILLGLARGFGLLFRRFDQPPLTAEILVGVFLGPTILGRYFPEFHGYLFPPDAIQQAMLETMAWIGVLFLLLQTGMEIDFSVAWRQRGNALLIALSDIVIPMTLAFIPCYFLPERYLLDPSQRLIFALFMAVVMTISAMPVAARLLHDLNVLKADLGFLIMSALAVNDIVGWVLFTIILGFFTHAGMSAGTAFLVFAATVGFAFFALTIGRRFSNGAFDLIKRKRFPEPSTSLTFACLLGLLCGLITQGLGIHALFGFFIAGVMIGEAKSLSEETRNIIGQMVYAIFVPLFFTNIGLKIDFMTAFDPFLVTLIFCVGVLGRYLGAWLGVGLTQVPRVNRHLISVAHTPGGMMEVVVALLALESGLINQTVFVAIVFGAVFSSVLTGPWLRQAMRRRAAVPLMDFLARQAILPSLSAVSRSEAIQEMAESLRATLKTVDPRTVWESAMERENQFGTAVGNALAIPHVRVAGIKNPILAFANSRQGIEWDAPDGKPVHYVFLLVSPAGLEDVHVQILANIGAVMRRGESRDLIGQAQDGAATWRVLDGLFRGAQGVREARSLSSTS